MEDDTNTEHPEGVVEINVASRNTGLDFIAPQVTFKERTLAQLFKEILDSSKCPVSNGKSDGKHMDLFGQPERT